MVKKFLKTIFLTGGELRIFWTLISVIVLIILGEYLIVKPFTRLICTFGFSEVTGVIPKDWPSAMGDSIKRITRMLVVFFSIFIVLKYFLKKFLVFIGVNFKKHNLKQIFLGLGLGFIVQIVSLLVMLLFGWITIEGYIWDFNYSQLLVPAIFYSIVYCIETGVIEETFFRGIGFNLIEKRYQTAIAVIVTSILFGIVHFSGFNEEFAWWFSISSSIICGLVFVQSFLLYRNLWLPIAFHAGWHLAMRTLGTVGIQSHESIFLVTKVDGPPMMVSTKAGGAGLSELLGILVVSFILALLKRKKS